MSIKLRYLKSKPVCKATFKLSKKQAGGAGKAALVGEFNLWNTQTHPMTKLKDGSFSITIELEQNREYEFRYFLDNSRWTNEPDAQNQVPTPFGDGENSVIHT